MGCYGQAFYQLPDDDKATLAEEMARTGIQEQSYSTAACEGGPAFLVRAFISTDCCLTLYSIPVPRLAFPYLLDVHVQVYYSPAFLRKSSGHLLAALRVLASVYRAARSLFPVSNSEGSSGTIVYIDQLNAAGPADDLCSACGDGQMWLLVRQSDREAVVQRYSLFDHNFFEPPAKACHVLRITSSLLSP